MLMLFLAQNDRIDTNGYTRLADAFQVPPENPLDIIIESSSNMVLYVSFFYKNVSIHDS